jgi:AcrR family transcriptional regulator
MDRRKAILNAAISLFAERGFNATPTSAVAGMAGVAEGLIFHYFKNKEGIFAHIINDMVDTYIEKVEAITENARTGLEAIEDIIHFHFRFSEENSKEFLVAIRDFPFDLMKPGAHFWEMIAERNAYISTLMKRCIERGQKDGSIREFNPEKAVFIIRGMLNGISRSKLLGTLRMPGLTSEVLDFCRNGLGTPI